ncbi:MAG: trehalose-phosphatase [Acidobacteria bacterium]|nr:trehalose-phosphatase [Acidobacteriota bacterium]
MGRGPSANRGRSRGRRPGDGGDRIVGSGGGNILVRRHLPTLGQFAASNVLLAFDYDGTLSPIASTPERARMRARTHRLLARVARRYPCVVISGRTLRDLSKRLDRLPLWHLFGNHGLEPWDLSEAYAARVRQWVRLLNRYLPAHTGLVVENKKYSVTVHYRQVRDKRPVLGAIADALRDLPDARALGGSQAVNLIPAGGPNKGVALERARRLFGCQTAIYIGDDDTDEDAFASGPPDRLLSIRVGATRFSRARYRLNNQGDIDRLLQILLTLRSSPDAPPEAAATA